MTWQRTGPLFSLGDLTAIIAVPGYVEPREKIRDRREGRNYAVPFKRLTSAQHEVDRAT